MHEKQQPIRLDQFLKLIGVASTGGHAKILIQSDAVKLNGEIETRRRKQLNVKDVVTVAGREFIVGDVIGE